MGNSHTSKKEKVIEPQKSAVVDTANYKTRPPNLVYEDLSLINKLPQEILGAILGLLEIQDSAISRLVCKLWKTVTLQTALIRFRFIFL